MPRAAGPFPITAKFGDNAYQVELSTEYNVTNTFNVGELQLYKEDQELRSILPQEGGVEPCSPYSEHGPSTEDTQIDPTDPTQRHSTTHMKHPIQEHEGNKNSSKNQATPTQKEHNGLADHSVYSSSHQNTDATDQQHPGDQATLHLCLTSDHTCPEMSQPGNGILAHGPSHQGPRTLLVIITEP